MTNGQRTVSLIAIYAAVFAWGISFAGLMPLLALTMENNGESTLSIGIMGAIIPVGVIVAAPFVPAIVNRLGTAMTIVSSSILSLVTVALLPVFDSYGSWLVLRFISGLFGAAPWIITESWLNTIAVENMRSRITAIYGSVMAASFAAGPFILTLVGVEGVRPFVYCTIAMIIGVVPLVLVWKLAPNLDLTGGVKISGIIAAMPSLLAAVLVCGIVDMSLFSFLPIWGLRIGYDQNISIILLSVFVMGNVVLQLPIGWIADRTDRRMVLVVCGVVAILGPIAVTILSGNLFAMGTMLFLWGGSVWALYTVSLAMLGQRFKAGGLTAASAAMVIAYEIANVIGPPAAGYAITLWEPNGLMVLMCGTAVIFVVLITTRGLIKGRETQDSA